MEGSRGGGQEALPLSTLAGPHRAGVSIAQHTAARSPRRHSGSGRAADRSTAQHSVAQQAHHGRSEHAQ